MDNLLTRRFEELTSQLTALEATKSERWNAYIDAAVDDIDSNALLNWTVKAKNLLSKACGDGSQHYKHFTFAEKGGDYFTNWDNLLRMKAVFSAAKEDFDGGYLASVHSLIQAQVFGSELEQASELLKSHYAVAAAIIAGVVLETCVGDLCKRHNIPHGKLDKMNADLVKANVYNTLTQKRITYLAGIRNSAAHGNQAEFKAHDVTAMIEEVERFLSQHLN